MAVIQIHQIFVSRQMKNKKNLADTRFFSDQKTLLYFSCVVTNDL